MLPPPGPGNFSFGASTFVDWGQQLFRSCHQVKIFLKLNCHWKILHLQVQLMKTDAGRPQYLESPPQKRELQPQFWDMFGTRSIQPTPPGTSCTISAKINCLTWLFSHILNGFMYGLLGLWDLASAKGFNQKSTANDLYRWGIVLSSPELKSSST